MPSLPPLTVFDLETTGLDPRRGHRIIEIAGVRIENGTIQTSQPFVAFVNPEREIPAEARQINKISDEDVRSAPTVDIVLPQFLHFAEGSVLLAHNAAFDSGFLEVEKEYCWGYVELPEILCTMQLSRNLHPHEFRHNLDILARKYALALPSERHRALADTLLTAQLLLKMIEKGNVRTLDHLRKLASIRQLVA